MTPTQEERLAVIERDHEAIHSEIMECKRNCARWQDDWHNEFDKFKTELREDLKDIYKEMNKRLPLWATAIGGLLLAALGWMVGSG